MTNRPITFLGKSIRLRRKKDLQIVHFEIVRGCQLGCLGCPISTLKPKVERIEVPVFAQCLQNMDVESVASFCLFNYGEPLLHHDLPGIMESIRRARFKALGVEISTNAQHVDWDQMREAMHSRVLTNLVVSCDGNGTKEDYERLRPPSRWDRLIEFLKRVREIQKETPWVNLMTRTAIQTTASAAAWNDILLPLGWYPEFRPFYDLPDGLVNLGTYKGGPGKGICSSAQNRHNVFIDVEGVVVPCCAHSRAGVFGDLKTEKLSGIQRGQKRRSFLEAMQYNRESLDACSKCPSGDAPTPAWGFQ